MLDDITSLQRLRCYHLPKNFSQADLALRRLLETVHLMVVYHTSFPEEFPHDWTADQQKIFPEDENTYSEAELSCLRLIEERLFPFALDHLLTCADEGERLSTIPLWSYGIDRGERPLSSFEPGWRMLLLLVEKTEEEGVEELGANVLHILGQAKHSGRGISFESLDTCCQQEDVPLRSFPIALRMIDHSTGNAFLDPTGEIPCEDLYWDKDDIALLAQHWSEAQTMITQADAFAEWLAANPQHLRKVVHLWNQVQRAF